MKTLVRPERYDPDLDVPTWHVLGTDGQPLAGAERLGSRWVPFVFRRSGQRSAPLYSLAAETRDRALLNAEWEANHRFS